MRSRGRSRAHPAARQHTDRSVVRRFLWIGEIGVRLGELEALCADHPIPPGYERVASSKSMPPRQLPPFYDPLRCRKCGMDLTREP